MGTTSFVVIGQEGKAIHIADALGSPLCGGNSGRNLRRTLEVIDASGPATCKRCLRSWEARR